MSASKSNWNKIKSADTFNGSVNEENILGSGRFGEVFRFADAAGNLFALKRIRFPDELDGYDIPPTDIENIELLMSLNHKNIVRLFRVERGKRQIYLFLELMDGGNLQKLIETYTAKKKVLPLQTVKAYTTQMLLGLQYLHSRHIVHRDIKPANMLLNAKKTVVKLTDFSLSKLISTTVGKATQSGGGTYHYMAPEVVRCESFSVKSDIWSLGVTLVELLTGKPTFPNIKTDATLINEISQLGKTKLKPEYDLSNVEGLSADTQELLDKIFQPFPTERPSASALLALDYFSLVDEDGSDDNSSVESEYSLNKDYKGRTLILNNENYAKQAKRVGSKVDATRLKDTFDAVGFKVVIETDQTAMQMLESIKTFALDPNNKKYSSFVVCILAHGSDSGIAGIDEKLLRLKEILAALSSVNAPLLSSKPKVLIIQACRGPDANAILNVAAARKSAKEKSNLASVSTIAASPITEKPVNVKAAFEKDYASSSPSSTSRGPSENDDSILDEDSVILEFATSKSDILVAYSTCSGYVSFRNENNGSIFIQSICDAVQKYWRKMSLLDMLAIVSGQVGSAVFNQSRESFTQIPQIKSTLRHRFFLSFTDERALGQKPVIATNQTSSSQRNVSSSRSTTAAANSNSSSNTSAKSSSRPSSSVSNAARNVGSAAKRSQPKQLLLVTSASHIRETSAYDTGSDSWVMVTPMSCSRFGRAATVFNGKMVVAGGTNDEDEYLDTVEQFEPESNSWTALPSMQNSREFLALVCFDHTMFAIGGRDSINYKDSVERYNLTTKQWQLVAALNVQRGGHCCVALGVGILAIGGEDNSQILNTCEMFDGATQNWKFVASLATARGYASAAGLNDKVYVFGGYDVKLKDLDSVEEYNSAADTWTLIPVKLSFARHHLAAATVDGRIYVCGGYIIDKDSDCRVVDCFDASAMQIRRASPLPNSILMPTAVSIAVSEETVRQLFKNNK